MITPEIVSYIRSQLAAGVTRESLSASLVSQGWRLEDVQEAFNFISPPMPTSSGVSSTPVSQPSSYVPPVVSNQPVPAMAAQSAVAVKKGWTVGKIILWIFIIGFAASILATAGFAYYAYSNITSAPSKICSSVSATDQANCQQMVKNFFGFLMKNAQNSSSANRSGENGSANQLSGTSPDESGGCSQGFTDTDAGFGGIGDITSLIGINDPLICYYSQSADLSGFSKVIIDISGSKVSSNEDDVRIVSETKNQKVTFYKKDGSSRTFEAATSSPVFAGLMGVYLDLFRIQIPILQLCIKSTNWNVKGDWFSCDKLTFLGVTSSDNNPDNSEIAGIRLYEGDTPLGKALFMETRNVENGKLSVTSMEILREGRLSKYNRILDISDYKGGTDLMTSKSIEELSAMYPNAQYTNMEYSYER